MSYYQQALKKRAFSPTPKRRSEVRRPETAKGSNKVKAKQASVSISKGSVSESDSRSRSKTKTIFKSLASPPQSESPSVGTLVSLDESFRSFDFAGHEEEFWSARLSPSLDVPGIVKGKYRIRSRADNKSDKRNNNNNGNSATSTFDPCSEMGKDSASTHFILSPKRESFNLVAEEGEFCTCQGGHEGEDQGQGQGQTSTGTPLPLTPRKFPKNLISSARKAHPPSDPELTPTMGESHSALVEQMRALNRQVLAEYDAKKESVLASNLSQLEKFGALNRFYENHISDLREQADVFYSYYESQALALREDNASFSGQYRALGRKCDKVRMELLLTQKLYSELQQELCYKETIVKEQMEEIQKLRQKVDKNASKGESRSSDSEDRKALMRLIRNFCKTGTWTLDSSVKIAPETLQQVFNGYGSVIGKKFVSEDRLGQNQNLSLADELQHAKTKEELQADLERCQLKVFSKGKKLQKLNIEEQCARIRLHELRKDENILRYKVHRLLELSQDPSNPNLDPHDLDPEVNANPNSKGKDESLNSSRSPSRIQDFNYVWSADGDN